MGPRAMKPSANPLLWELGDSGPDRPFWIGFHSCTGGPRTPQHFHQWFELGAVEAGSGILRLEETDHPLEPGDLYLFNGLLPHCHRSASLQLAVVHLSFSALFLGDLPFTPHFLWSTFASRGPRAVGPVVKNRPELAREIRLAGEEFASGVWGGDFEAYLRVLKVLALLSRSGGEAPPEQADRNHGRLLSRCCRFIEARFGEGFTVQDLAGHAGASVSLIAHLFKAQMGCSPLKYRDGLRLTRALDLLENTDRKIADIALECGFLETSQFNRVFRRALRLSPREFRARRGKADGEGRSGRVPGRENPPPASP